MFSLRLSIETTLMCSCGHVHVLHFPNNSVVVALQVYLKGNTSHNFGETNWKLLLFPFVFQTNDYSENNNWCFWIHMKFNDNLKQVTILL